VVPSDPLKYRLFVCSLLAGHGFCGDAQAGGFSVARFAGEHGHPTTENGTALYFNPAALAYSEQARLFGDLTLALLRVTYTRAPHPSDAAPPLDAPNANVGRATLNDVLIAPALVASVPWESWSFAVGWFTPFGGSVSWERRESFAEHPRLPGPVDGVQRWHSIEGHVYASNLSVGAARTLFDELSIGASLNLIGASLSDVRARGDGTNDPEKEGRALVQAKGLAVGFGLGLAYRAVPRRLWFGVSYQSRPNVRGGMTLEGRARGNLGTTTSSDVDVSFDLPDVVRAGLRYRPRSWLELRLFGDYTRWSAFEGQCIRFDGGACRLARDGSQLSGSRVLQNLPREFEDSAGLRAGVSTFPNTALEVFSGIGFDSRAVPDRTMEPSLPDFAMFSFAAGVRALVFSRLRAALSITEYLAIPREVEGSLASYEVPSKQPDASGHYSQFVGALNLNVEYSF